MKNTLDEVKNKDMSEGIIIAIIGAAGVILAAVIGLLKKNNTAEKNINIKQKQEIKNKGTQIGIQNNYSSYEKTKGKENDE